MGDIGDFWSDVRQSRKAAALATRRGVRPSAEPPTKKQVHALRACGFEQKFTWHWQRLLDGNVLDYWPSKSKWQFRGVIAVGKWTDLVALIEQNTKVGV